MLGAKLGSVCDYLSLVCREIQRLDALQIEKVSELDRSRIYDQGRFVFICGNGGSGCQFLSFLRGPRQMHLMRDF